jgi:hypothetical protein
MAESLLIRKGGGGAKIEEPLINVNVESGQTVTAGTFVEIVEKNSYNSFQNISQIPSGNANPGSQRNSIFELSNNKVIITFHNSSNHYAAVVAKFVNGAFVYGTPVVLNSSSTVRFEGYLGEKIDENRLLLVYRHNGSTSIFSRILIVNDTTITLNTETVVETSGGLPDVNTTRGGLPRISPFWLSSFNQIYILGFRNSSNNPAAKALIVNLTNNSVTAGATLQLISGGNFFTPVIEKFKQNQVIACWQSGSSSQTINVYVISVSNPDTFALSLDNTITFNSSNNTQIFTWTPRYLGEGRVVFVYNFFRSGADAEIFYNLLRDMGSGGISMAGQNLFSVFSGSFSGFDIRQVSAAKYIMAARFPTLSAFRFVVGEMAPNTFFSMSNPVTIPLASPYSDYSSFMYLKRLNSRQFVFLQEKNSTTPELTVFTDPVTVKNSLNSKIDGIAKTGGTAGQTVEVFVND